MDSFQIRVVDTELFLAESDLQHLKNIINNAIQGDREGEIIRQLNSQ